MFGTQNAGPTRAVGENHPEEKVDVQTVTRWDSTGYGGDAVAAGSFAMEINDRRSESGQVFVDIAPTSGNVDDMLTVGVEIAVDPHTLSEAPCIKLAASGEEQSLSAYQLGDKLLLVPGNGLLVKAVRLYDGSFGYMLGTP